MDDIEIEIGDVNLNVKEKFVVLILSTVAGFAASQLTERGVTNFIKARRSS